METADSGEVLHRPLAVESVLSNLPASLMKSLANGDILSQSGGEKCPPHLQRLLNHIQQILANAQKNKILPQKEIINNQTTLIRLRVPKRPEKKIEYKEDTDEYIDINSEKIQKRKTTLRFNIQNRQTSRFNSMPSNRGFTPKRVLTPDWESSHSKEVTKPIQMPISETSTMEDTSFENVWNDLPITEKHQKIEVFESRIIWGLGESYTHPAQAVDLAKQGAPIVLSSEEMIRSSRYDCQRSQHIVPKFWEPRPWDQPQDFLDDNQTEELEQTIQILAPNLPRLPLSPKLKRSPISRSMSSNTIGSGRRGRPRKNMPELDILTLPIGSFETDREDISDWDDFY